MTTQQLNPRMFRAYDIRGVLGDDLTPDVTARIGAAYATYMGAQYGVHQVAVARDNRPSSEALCDGLVAGIRAAGASVVDIGLAPSPLLSYAAAEWGIDGGVVVTASHSPREYNGLKLLERRGIPLGPDEIQTVFRIADNADFSAGNGAIEQREPIPDYLAYLEHRFRLRRPLRVVVDPGNGVATLTGPEALRRIGCEVITLNAELDGAFPAYIPNPQDPRTMDGLIAEVRRSGADFGIAWDADGDRLGVVDETGTRHEADAILAALACDFLQRQPGARVYVDVKLSLSAILAIEEHGGRPFMGATGHSLAKRAMRDEGILFGGEGSGHFYFAEDYYGLDDAVFGACSVARLLANGDAPLSSYFSTLRRFVTSPELRFPCPDEAKLEIAQAVTAHFRDDYPVLEIDGARIDFGDGWALVRAANTGPELSVRIEAETERRFDEIAAIVFDVLRAHPAVAIPVDVELRPR